MSLLDHELDNLSTARLRELAADKATSPPIKAAVDELLTERDRQALRGHEFIRQAFPNRPAL